MRISIFLICILLTGCSVFKKAPAYEPKSFIGVCEYTIYPQAHRPQLPKELYLENRMSCDSAIAFMEHVISPGELLTPDSKMYSNIIASFHIPYEYEKLPNKKSAKRCYNRRVPYCQFYLAPKCFVNMDAQKVYDIFIKPEYHDRLKQIEQEAGEYGYGLNMQDVIYFFIRDSKVQSSQ